MPVMNIKELSGDGIVIFEMDIYWQKEMVSSVEVVRLKAKEWILGTEVVLWGNDEWEQTPLQSGLPKWIGIYWEYIPSNGRIYMKNQRNIERSLSNPHSNFHHALKITVGRMDGQSYPRDAQYPSDEYMIDHFIFWVDPSDEDISRLRTHPIVYEGFAITALSRENEYIYSSGYDAYVFNAPAKRVFSFAPKPQPASSNVYPYYDLTELEDTVGVTYALGVMWYSDNTYLPSGPFPDLFYRPARKLFLIRKFPRSSFIFFMATLLEDKGYEQLWGFDNHLNSLEAIGGG